ncbi:fimbrial chaperone protein, partial [Salmonella enterica subsp. enterica serovar Typhimurium]|uniref:fimbrial biogenesis chaperone n=1 Tax=Salmonella enterica TaxID=28901 RepID=UPI00125ABDAF
RPNALGVGRRNAENTLQLAHRGGEAYRKNPTPDYFAVTGVKLNGQPVRLNDRVMNEIAPLAPKSEVALGKLSLNGTVTVQAVNDWGGTQDYTLK